MTLFKAPGSQSLTDHDLLELSQSADVNTGLVLQNPSFIAVTELLVQYRNIFESSYGVLFAEARISNVCKKLGVLWTFARCGSRHGSASRSYDETSAPLPGGFRAR